MAWTKDKATKLIALVKNEKSFISNHIKLAEKNQNHPNWKAQKCSYYELEHKAKLELKRQVRKSLLAEKWLEKHGMIVSSSRVVSSFKTEHAAYLQSDNWKLLKEKYRSDISRKQECWGCGISHKIKAHDFHHLHYDSFKCETLDDIIPVCRSCHSEIHALHRKLKILSIQDVTSKFINRFQK